MRYFHFPKIKLPPFKKVFRESVINSLINAKNDVKKLLIDTNKLAANVLFEISAEPALIMIFFNALASYSSHTAQIKGLENSHRENRDFLIDQEKKERKLDLALTIVPPSLINHVLKRKFESGEFITPSALKKLRRNFAEGAGSKQNELFLPARKPLGLRIFNAYAACVNIAMKYINALPEEYADFKLKAGYFNDKLQQRRAARAKIEKRPFEYTAGLYDTRFAEGHMKPYGKNVKLMHNNSAYDELFGQQTGICLLAVLLYTLTASNIVIPYIRSRWTKKEFDKKLAETGETRRSMIRKNRWEFTRKTSIDSHGKIFDSFYDKSPVKFEMPDTNMIKIHRDTMYKNYGLKI